MKIIIVDGDRELLRSLQMILSWEKDIQVLGSFDSATGVTEAIRRNPPDILLTDTGLSGVSGLELIYEVKSLFPEVNIIAYTGDDNKETACNAIKAGATGYLVKGASSTELINALHEAYAGGVPMTRRIAKAVIAELQQHAGPEEEEILTERESEILREVDAGLTYHQIASKYSLSYNTIHSHVKSSYKKLHATNRKELLHKAKHKGFL